MPFRGASVLQFDECKQLLATFAASDAAKQRILNTDIFPARQQAEAELAETSEAINYFAEAAGSTQSGFGAASRLHFDRLGNVEFSLPALRVAGARLEAKEILDLFAVLELAGEYRAVLLAVGSRYPLLAKRAANLADLRPLVRRYGRVLLPDGTLADDASPELRRIRRDLERQRKNIQESLDRFLRSHRDDGTLQEAFVTVREDRYVVPVVAGQKGRVDGIIHGASGSGRTLYMEPLETIALNNQLVRLREEELREIERILLEITDELREHAAEIVASVDTLIALDCLFAKAGFADRYHAVIPRFSDPQSRRLSLTAARHPLLESVLRKQRKAIVPLSLELDERRRILLISGPNTGGKTVTMKTCGLLVLMAHAAFPVPCENAEIPWLDELLADIGDTQSIAESLSTFSGHLVRVREMLEIVTPDTLVLLDELGGSTDPDEGGALGVAILDRFRQHGAFCLASTHLLPLKLYGTQTDGVVNASMGFDEETLQPTYRLKIGMPGKSAGLDIAARLDLPADLIAHARSVLPRLQADFQSLLTRLETQLEESERLNADLRRQTKDLESRRAQLEHEWEQRESKRLRTWERKREELIADFEARALDTIAQVRESVTQAKTGPAEAKQSPAERKLVEQATLNVAKARREFREQAESVMQPSTPAPPAKKPVLEEGVRVRLRDIREPAVIRRILKNGLIEVEAGFLRMQVSPNDVVEVVTAGQARQMPKNITVQTGPRWDTSYKEINLIGKTAEEASEELERFLDSAALAEVNRVRIIHGHGMGVLKRAVSNLLKTNPHVARFEPASSSEGGAGATIAELRE